MVASEALQNLVTQKASYQKIREVVKEAGMQSLYDSAIKKVNAGVTSLEEAISVTLGAE
jgi:type II secretory ATPase GspE/PulE/Tfp pilus assembly ATPase PilB-like protein